MGTFVPSIIISSLIFAGSTAVNLKLHMAYAKDSTNLRKIEKAKLVAQPILITMAIIFVSLTIGLFISKFSHIVVVSQTIDFLFHTSLISVTFSIIASLYTLIKAELKEIPIWR